MGHRFNHNIHQRNTTNGIFLPMLCSRSSIKDGHVIADWQRNHSKDIPSSPKVSCIGQVKNNLRNNNKIAGFPAPPYKFSTTSSAAKPVPLNTKYHKFKRLFSGKNLATPTPTSVLKPSRSTRVTSCHAQNCGLSPTTVLVDITTLDPPLPVAKKTEQASEAGNLWKRRSCGGSLRTLQVEKVHVPSISNNSNLQPTTV